MLIIKLFQANGLLHTIGIYCSLKLVKSSYRGLVCTYFTAPF